MGKKLDEILAKGLKDTTLKGTYKTAPVALSWNEISSKDFAKGADAANESISTLEEQDYAKSLLQKEAQAVKLKEENQNKEAKETLQNEQASLTSEKLKIQKEIDSLFKANAPVVYTPTLEESLQGKVPEFKLPQLTPEQQVKYQELKTKQELITKTLGEKATKLKSNPEAQKVMDYTKEKSKLFNWKPTTYRPLAVPFENTPFMPAVPGNTAEYMLNKSLSFITNSAAGLANWTDSVVTNFADSFTDEAKEVEKRSKLSPDNSQYIDKEKYYTGKKFQQEQDNAIASSLKLEAEQKLRTVREENKRLGIDVNTNTFEPTKIQSTFIENRLLRDIETLDAIIEKKSGLDNYAREIFGKTMINPAGNITFLENIRNAQYEYFWENDINEDLNERLKAKAKQKGVKDLSELSEKDFQETFDTLSELDQLAMLTKYQKLTIDSLGQDNLSASYKLMQGTGQSADFIVSLLATRGMGSLAGKGLQLTVPALRTTNGVKLTAKALTNRGMSAKMAETVAQRAGTFSSVVGQGTAITYINPRELTGPRYSVYKSLDDSQDKPTAVFGREGAYGLAKREVAEDKKTFQKIYDHLKNNESALSEEDKNLLNYVSGALGYTKDATYVNEKGETVPVESLDEQLKTYEVNSKAYIHGRGITANVIETATEIYTADVLKYLGKGGKQVLDKIPGTNKVVASLTGKLDNIQKYYATSRLGRLQRDYNFYTGKYTGASSGIIGSVPEEIVEEYAAAATNSLVDWDLKELDEAFTFDFLQDVTLQTLLLNGSMKAPGAVPVLGKRLYGAMYDKKIANYDNRIKELETFLAENPEDSDTKRAIAQVRAEKINAIKNNSLTGFGISKKVNKQHDAYSNTRKFLDKKANVRKAIDELKGANTDADVLEIINHLDPATNEAAKMRKILEARGTGKVEIAELLEQSLDYGILRDAVNTHSEKDLQGALGMVLRDKSRNLSAEQKKRFTNLSNTVTELADFREENKNSQGEVQIAMALKLQQISAKLAKQAIVDQRSSIQQNALQEFESMYDTYFASSDITKTEATQAFLTGKLLDNDKFEPVLEKMKVLGLKGVTGYTESFISEEKLLGAMNSLDLAIAENLNPPAHIEARNAFNKEFAELYNKLNNNTLTDLSDLGISEVEYNPNNTIIPTSKLEMTILEKLMDKYKKEGKFTDAQAKEILLKMENVVKATKAQNKEIEKLIKEVEAQAAATLKVEEPETTPNQDPVVIVDADGQVASQEVIESTVAQITSEPTPAIVVSSDSLLDDEDTGIPKAPNQDQIPDLSISLEDYSDEQKEAIEKNVALYTKLLDYFLPQVYEALDSYDVSFKYVLEEILNISTPSQKQKISQSIGSFIRAWDRVKKPSPIKDTGADLSEKERWEIFKMANAKFSDEVLGKFHSIFEVEVTPNQVESNFESMEALEDEKKKAEAISQIEPVEVPVTPVAIVEDVNDLSLLEEELLKKEILKGTHPLSEKILPLVEADIDFWEAYTMVTKGIKETQKVQSDANELFVLPYMGYNALPYEWVEITDQNGVTRRVKRTVVGATLNIGGNDRYIRLDIRDLLHPDLHISGSTLGIEVAKEEDWDNIIHEEITLEEDTIQPDGSILPAGSKTIISFGDFMRSQPANFRSTKEFKEVLPIFVTDAKGKRLAYVHTGTWYTPYSIPFPGNEMEKGPAENEENPGDLWLETIRRHKEGTLRLREAIFAGLTKVKISKPLEGKAGMIVEGEKLITIQESNPQATLIVQKGFGLQAINNALAKKDIGFATGKKRIVNKDSDFKTYTTEDGEVMNPDGHTWAIHRVGSTPHATIPGEIVETYRAVQLHRKVSEDQIETLRWAIAAYKVSQGKSLPDHRKAEYSLTPEQAKEIISKVREATKIDISDFKGIGKFMGLFMKIENSHIKKYEAEVNAKKKEGADAAKYGVTSVAPYLHYLFEAEGVNLSGIAEQHTDKDFLDTLESGTFKVIPKITRNGVENYTDADGNPMGYPRYLKETLFTGYKAFDMDSTGTAPLYSITVQPKITMTFENKDIDNSKAVTSPTEVTLQNKIEEAAKEALEEVETSTEVVSEFTEQDLDKVISRLEKLKIDYTTFLDGDNAVGSLEELKELYNLVGNLKVNQEKVIVGEITSTINSLLGFKAKVSASTIQSIKNTTEAKLTSKLKEVLSELVIHKTKVANSSIKNEKAEAVVKAIETHIVNITDVLENFDTLFAKGLEKALGETRVKQAETNEVVEEGDIEKEKNFSKESIEEKLKDKASSQIRMIMHSVPSFDNNGEPIADYLGLTPYMSLNDTYNLVLRVVSANVDNTATFEDIIGKLAKSEHPAIKIIIERLQGSDQQVKNQFVYNITAHALSSKFVMYNEEKGTVSMKLYDTNSAEITRQIKQKWVENSRFTELYHTDGSFNKVYAQKLINEFRALGVTPQTADQKILRAWLGKLGMTFHDKTWEKLYTKGFTKNNVTTSFSELVTHKKFGLFPNLINFLEKGLANEETYTINSDNTILSEIGSISNNIALIEADYNPELISLSYQDNGKSIFTLTPPKYMTERIRDLVKREGNFGEKSSKLVEDLLKLSYNKNSLYLEYLRDIPEVSDLLKIHHVSLGAIKNKNQKDSQGGITELSALDYDMFALGGLQDRKIVNLSTPVEKQGIVVRMANMLGVTMSDKDTGLFLTVPVLDLLKSDKVAFTYTEEGEILMTQDLLKVLGDLIVKPELERIINYYQKVKKTGVKNYDKPATLFHHIPALNAIQVNGMNLVEYLASEEVSNKNVEEIYATIKTEVDNRLQKVVTSEAKKKGEAWKKDGLVKNKSGKVVNKIFNDSYFKDVKKDAVKDFDLGVMDFVINSLIFQAESAKVFLGDIAQFSQDKVWAKVIKEASARDKVDHTLYTLQTQDYIKANKEIGTNLGKRLAYLIAPGKKISITEENRFYNQLFLEDAKDIAENTLDLIEMYEGLAARKKSKTIVTKYKSLQNKLASLQDKSTLTEKERNLKEQLPAEIEKIRDTLINNFPSLKDYFEIESTDAQEYTTITEHLQILHSIGRINKSQYDRILTNLSVGKDLEYEDLNLIMQPIKPVHTGMYAMEDIDLARVVYIKSSSFPLIPELTRGTSLDKLRIAMEKLESETGRFTRASYQSANKVGAVKNAINPLDEVSLQSIFDYKDNANEDSTSPMLVLNRENFRIQQDVPFKSGKSKADTVSLGTQIFKMLFSDGVVDVDTQSFNYKGKNITGRELYKKYEDSFNKIIDYETQKLYKDLGLNEKGQIINEKLFMSSLRDVLRQEAIDRGYSLKEIRTLDLVELVDINTKETYYDFKNPLWLSSNSNKYEALLNSIITNKVMQFKMPGNAFVAGSENGFRFQEGINSLSEKDKNKVIYLDGWNGTELQGTHFTEEGGTPVFTSAQVMITSKIKDSNNKLIDLFEGFDINSGDVTNAKYLKRNENGTLGLKENVIDPELFKMFSFRTPTSSHISGSSIEIVGILPPASGDLMLVPKNFTKQKGLDYDIDKESAYSFNHYINNDGEVKIVDEEYLEAVKQGDIRLSLITTSDFDATEYYNKRKAYFTDRREDLRSIKTIRNAIRNKRIIEAEIADLTYISSTINKGKNKDEEAVNELDTLINNAVLDLEIVKGVISEIENTSRLKANFNKQEFEAEKERLIAEYETLYADLESIYLKEIENQHVKSIEKKIAQNDFVRVYMSVYTSSSKEVQKKLNSILSMDVASKQAETLASWKEEGIKNDYIQKQKEAGLNGEQAAKAYQEEFENFTMFSYSYQKAKMDLGAIGKKAIGVYATAATFSALVQTRKSKGLPMEAFTIGNYTSTTIGAVKTLGTKNQRVLSEVLGERINTATDNEKEQILGRVGVDDLTIGVDSFLALRGFDLGESGNSIPYMLFSQPAVVEFNKKIKEGKGILGKWQDEKKLIADTVYELSNKKISYVQDSDTKKWHFFETNSTGLRQELKGGSPLLTEDVLEEGIKSGKAAGLNQAHALVTYIQAKQLSERLTPLVSSLNTNTLGKSIPEAMVKHAKMGRALFKSDKFLLGFQSLIGEESSDPEEGYPFEVVNAEGLPETFYITPTTPQGKIAVTGLHLGKVLFEKLFTYNDSDLKQVMDRIIELQGIEEDRIKAEDYELIVQEFKKYLFSNPKLMGTFKDASLKRFELMMDTEQNDSLSTYMHSLLKNKDPQYAKGVEKIKENPLVGKRLSFKVGKGDTEVATITFNNSATDSLSDEELYLSLPDLMLENLALPPKNGKPYTTQDLVEDLVAYSFLEGNVQKATQFTKFIPVELQSAIGRVNPTTGDFVSINQQLQNYNPRRIPLSMKKEVFGVNEMPGFILQFFQNNPTAAPRVSYEDVLINFTEEVKTLSLKPERMAINTPELVHFVDRDKKVHLFQHIGAGQYTYLEHNVVNKKTSQYNKGGIFESVLSEEVKSKKVAQLLEEVSHDFKLQESLSLVDALQQIAVLPVSSNQRYLNQLAALFSSNVEKAKTFSVQNLGNKGKAVDGNVILDLGFLLNKATTNEKIAETIIHETVHSITVKELDKYFYTDTKTGEYSLIPEYASKEFALPMHVVELLDTYKAYLNSSKIDLDKLGKLKQQLKQIKDSSLSSQEVKALVNDLKAIFTEEEFERYYAAVNIKEFMSALFESQNFRQILDSIEYKKSGKTLLERFTDAILKVLNTIFPGLKDNYLAKEALLSSFKFMEVERKFNFEINKSVSLEEKELDSKFNASESVDIPEEPDFSIDLSEEEWNNLTTEEQQKIKDCY